MKLEGPIASVHDHAVAAAKRHGHGLVERRHVVVGLATFDVNTFRQHFPAADLAELERKLGPSGLSFAPPVDAADVHALFEQAMAGGGLEVLYRNLADLVSPAETTTSEEGVQSWSTVPATDAPAEALRELLFEVEGLTGMGEVK